MTTTYVDSNIWIYFFDSETPEHEVVLDNTRRILQTDELVINTVTVIEVAHYLSRRLDGVELRTRMNAMLDLIGMEVTGFDEALLRESIEILSEYAASSNLSGRDAVVLATMKTYGVDRLVTQDKTLKGVASSLGFLVVDPVKD
jgi:predicted nucleic acid-binding protein